MKQKIAIYLPLFSLLSYWYIELAAVLFSILVTGNILKVFNILKIKHITCLILFIIMEFIIMSILNYNMQKCFEQILLITTTATAYYIYFQYVIKKNICLFVKCYLNVNIIMNIYALIAYALHITISGRLESWGGEPGDISLLTLPALIYYFHHKEISLRSILTLIAFILSESTASYVALFITISLLLIVYNYKNLLKIILSLSIILSIGYTISNAISKEIPEKSNAMLKFQETINILQNDQINYYELESLNASTYAFITNLLVAKSAPSRLLGTGLGTHPINYKIEYPPQNTNYRLYGLNSNDAYSLTIRVFSELGYIGLFLLFFFLYRNFNSKSLFSFMAISYIINACITGGHYTANGGMLFFIFFYFSGKYIEKEALLKSTNKIQTKKKQYV